METSTLAEILKVAGLPGLLVFYMYTRDKLLADTLRDLAQAIRERPVKT